MPRVRDRDDPTERYNADLADCLAAVPLLRPAAPGSPAQRRLWRACELCTYLEYRFDAAPDPRSLTDETIHDWARRGLTDGEVPGDPADLLGYRPYWLVQDGTCLGTVAVMVRDLGWGQPCLWIASLYLFPEGRRRGCGTRVMAALEGAARHLGLGGLRLETAWPWQGAVRFYLQQGFWVANWKHGLSLVRYFADPPYRIRHDQGRMAFVIGAATADHARIAARRRGDTLIWEEHAPAGNSDDADADADAGEPETLASPAPTFALWLAVGGWPLIRGPREWERRYHWSDTGMPEGLAYKITVFEAYTRRCGFRVDTPRIPGLVYPPWEEL